MPGGSRGGICPPLSGGLKGGARPPHRREKNWTCQLPGMASNWHLDNMLKPLKSLCLWLLPLASRSYLKSRFRWKLEEKLKISTILRRPLVELTTDIVTLTVYLEDTRPVKIYAKFQPHQSNFHSFTAIWTCQKRLLPENGHFSQKSYQGKG